MLAPAVLWQPHDQVGDIISGYGNEQHTWLYPANWVLVSFGVQILEILIVEWVNTYYDRSLVIQEEMHSHLV